MNVDEFIELHQLEFDVTKCVAAQMFRDLIKCFEKTMKLLFEMDSLRIKCSVI